MDIQSAFALADEPGPYDEISIYGFTIKAAGIPFDVVARFFVSFRPDEDGCWAWKASCRPHGYGSFFFDGKGYPAHRFSYFLFGGERPEDRTHIHHKCENKACVRPDHLEGLDPAQHKAAHESKRTECLHGHPWIEENWIITKAGKKQCKLCHQATHAAWIANAEASGHQTVHRKTHCLRGHELTPENIALGMRGERNCRTCIRERTNARRHAAPPKPRKPRVLAPRVPKSHCVNGHEYTEENKYYHPKTGCIDCLTCRRERNKNYIRKK